MQITPATALTIKLSPLQVYFDSQNLALKEVLGNFLEYIQFHKIPANVLMREIHPLGLVPYSIIMNALAYQVGTQQADEGSEGEEQ